MDGLIDYFIQFTIITDIFCGLDSYVRCKDCITHYNIMYNIKP